MSEQAIDLRSTWATLRRRSAVLVVAACLGGGVGAAVGGVEPPVYHSTSKVLLTATTPAASAAAAPQSMDTHVEIAMSDAVLGPAGRLMSPHLSYDEVGQRVQVEASTDEVLLITASGRTAQLAQALASAVAVSEIAYIAGSASTATRGALNELEQRTTTLQASLTSVNGEIKETQTRLAGEKANSAEGRADAAALAQLTAQQANLVLQLDHVAKEKSDSQDPAATAGGIRATEIQPATPARKTPIALHISLYGGAGAAALGFVVAVLLLIFGRRERTRRSRDEIADAVGIPVVASLESRAARSVAGWISLLKGYSPDNVEMWSLRQLIRLVTPGHPGTLATAPDDEREAACVVVLTLANDARALAVGPQLASFAAATGLRTHLVTAQPHDSANALWAACASLSMDEQPRPGLSIDHPTRGRFIGDLAVHVVVLDRQRPSLHLKAPGSAVTLLAVSSGNATADELARVALSADDAGHTIARIIVVDADPLDRTTGRLLPSERAQHAALPSLVTGSAVESDTSGPYRRRSRR